MSGCILHLEILHSPVFMLNSCLDLFSAPHLTGDPFSRGYRVNLPSSLTVSLSSALVYSTRLRVSVCGTGTSEVMFSGFSWEPDYHRYSIARGLSILSASARQADLPTRRLPTSFNLRFRRQAGVSLLRLHIAPISSNGIFTVSSIGYAVRLRLRARLTLIRLALIRNP